MNPTLTAIPYKEGIIYVNDDEIKNGDCAIDIENRIFQSKGKYQDKRDKKILAQSPNLNIEGIPYVEVEQEDGVEKLAEIKAEKFARKQCDDMYDVTAPSGMKWGEETMLDYRIGFIEGYRANPKRFTEEDLIDFHNFIKRHENQFKKMGEYIEEFKESLTPKIKSIELEMEEKLETIDNNNEHRRLKLTGTVFKPITYTKELRGEMKTFLKVKTT